MMSQKTWQGGSMKELTPSWRVSLILRAGGKPLGAFEGGSDRSKELPQRWAWLLGGERIGGSGTSCAHHGGMRPPVPVVGTGQTGEPDSHLPFGILQLIGHSV